MLIFVKQTKIHSSNAISCFNGSREFGLTPTNYRVPFKLLYYYIKYQCIALRKHIYKFKTIKINLSDRYAVFVTTSKLFYVLISQVNFTNPLTFNVNLSGKT